MALTSSFAGQGHCTSHDRFGQVTRFRHVSIADVPIRDWLVRAALRGSLSITGRAGQRRVKGGRHLADAGGAVAAVPICPDPALSWTTRLRGRAPEFGTEPSPCPSMGPGQVDARPPRGQSAVRGRGAKARSLAPTLRTRVDDLRVGGGTPDGDCLWPERPQREHHDTAIE